MFVIFGDKVIIAPQYVKCSHGEWFKKEGWSISRSLEKNPRGYVDAEGIYLYQGKNAVVPKVGNERLRRYVFELFLKLGLKKDLHIFLGTVRDGKINNRGKLPPKIDLGSIEKIIQTNRDTSANSRRTVYQIKCP